MIMRMHLWASVIGLVVGLQSAPVSAAENHHPAAEPAHTAGESAKAEHDTPGPVISDKAAWARRVIWGVFAMFAAAAFIGPIYRMNMPEEPQVEDFHSHDEPPGTSHHHGPGGTLDPSAPDKPHHH
jgi:hypothetical protein